ncbi:CehA/McbA family metallohydrolase [Clostridium sp. ZS2-4]|uniref:CehA/McbA family metallohydrolase n=1 Tax=Clostridium sp. ZS2-4 TaxID=2987703 RepID=UPI00227A065C|nr:CehA/McbA family metallohydrolase [Clostridium sp. ZS2-4]MCY6354442.1 CehA/McbA family metallohydrolase [Clostridium sp. ZS2-4]
MINWIPYELHTHTNHSDGKHTLMELALSASKLGLKGIAMTDHNTISTYKDIENMKNIANINILKGLEWTTFYGHVLLLGLKEYVDWRDITKENFSKKIQVAKGKVELIGIAHPFRIGSPIATGCYLEYTVEDWNKIDYIEVWSGMFPSIKQQNIRAFKLWTELLNKGFRISAVSGRDWHKSTPEDKYIAATYIGIDSEKGHKDNSIFEAIKKGCLSVSLGQVLTIDVLSGEKAWTIGDKISKFQLNNNLKVSINIMESSINVKHNIDKETLRVNINSNIGNIAMPNYDEEEVDITENIDSIKWIRGELYGVIDGEEVMVCFTNPIYFS